MAAEIFHPHILIAASVAEEAAGIKDRMTAMKQKRIGGRRIFDGGIGSAAVRLIETGPGLVNSAQGLTAAIEAERPSLILMTGCGGGFAAAGMSVGDIGIATEESDAHLGIETEKDGEPPAPLPFSLTIFGSLEIRHRIHLDPKLYEKARNVLETEFQHQPVHIVASPFVTVSTITATENGAKRHYQRFRPCMETMEGFGAALVAGHYGISFLEIRSVSNLVGKRDLSSWNMPLACRRSAEAAVIWIKSVSDDTGFLK